MAAANPCILVTGGAGYIGSHTCIELIKAGYDVTVVDNYCNSRSVGLERTKALVSRPEAIDFVELDIATPQGLEGLNALLTRKPHSAVIHFAALKAVADSIKRPLAYYRNNMDGLLNVLEACATHSIRRIVFSSSATVYGAGQPPFSEQSPTGSGITNPYGQTKFMAEIILQDFQKANPSFGVIALRYFNPVGAHSSGTIGEDPLGIPANLMPYLTRVAVGKLPKLTIYGNDYATPDGTAQRDYLHVVDLAEGHVAALKWLDGATSTATSSTSTSTSTGAYEAVNLGTGDPVSVLEMVRAFETASGVKIPFEFGPRRPGDADRVWADASKAKSMLGWEAKLKLSDMCADSWRWCSNNPSGYAAAMITASSSSGSSSGAGGEGAAK